MPVPKVAVLFTGQGSLNDHSLEVWSGTDHGRRITGIADGILEDPTEQASGILELSRIPDRYRQTRLGQLIVVTGQLTTWHTLTDRFSNVHELDPLLMGHSLGEHSALRASGIIGSDESSLRIVGTRALETSNAVRSARDKAGQIVATGMAAIIGKKDVVSDAVGEANNQSPGEEIYLANYNGGQIVVSGPLSTIERLRETFGKRFIGLEVEGAFHSPYAQAAVDGVKRVLESIKDYDNPKLRILSPTTRQKVGDSLAAIRMAIQQLTDPVFFDDAVEIMVDEEGVTHVLEIGSHPDDGPDGEKEKPGVLIGLTSRIRPGLVTARIAHPNHLDDPILQEEFGLVPAKRAA